MLQRRNGAYFKHSILEGTQSSVQTTGATTLALFFDGFNQGVKANKPTASQDARSSDTTNYPDGKNNQVSQKILLFEDVDQVFFDEGDFHNQLNKLIPVTKVPLILTMSDSRNVKESLINAIRESGVEYDIAHYKYVQIKKNEMNLALSFISLFEQFVGRLILEEDFQITEERFLRFKV